ncbi:MAG: hypothetical protein Q8Q00_01515 [Dehalococcoidia bacterium]|nr:hypothetical protein [Dehalococcoidia bacterium]
MPFELDVLEADLESKFPGFAAGLPVNWGLAVGAVPGSWDKVAQIAGMDWSAGFYPPKEFRVPLPRRSPSGRVVWRRVPTHCVVLSVTTGETDTNAARDRGRPAVRALLALMRREVPTIVPSDALWEGAVVWPGKGRVRMTGAALAVESATPASPSRLHKMGLKLAKVSVASFPPQLQQALQWLNLARSASVRPEKFIHLWLAVLTLASYGQPKKLSDMSRIRRYTNTMTLGIGGVRSPLSVAELNERLRKVYKIRNDLLHRAVDSQITLALLEQLESDAFELVDFELAKLGTSISAA